jgi:predicted NBD/HSP70 family sugar kinase
MWRFIHPRSKHLHEANGVRVLRLVRDHGTISRIEIAQATGLHKATITDLVAQLISAGFLEDTGELGTHRKVGRRRRLLRFLPLAGLVAGVDIRMTHVAVAITDLNAHVIAQDSFHYEIHDAVNTVLMRVAAMIKNLLKTSRHPVSKLVGIGIGIQGIVDRSTHILVLAENKAAWQGESLSTRLEQEFRIPVYAENDVKAMALGEYLFGAAKGTRDSVHLWVGEGIGAGIMINGQLLHGITSAAGEIGFNTLESSAVNGTTFPLTYHGQKIFGEILNNANLIESYRQHAGKNHGLNVTVPYVVERSRLGDHVAQQVIEEFVSLLNLLCTPMVNTLNPEMIVIGGKLAESFPAVSEMLQAKIHGDVLAPPAEAVRVRCAVNAEMGVILGAAGLVLYELFEPIQRENAAKHRQAVLDEDPAPETAVGIINS